MGSAWVVGVTLLIAFISFSAQLARLLVLARAHALAFNALVLVVLANYALVVRADPGKVPRGWRLPARVRESEPRALRTSLANPRFCRVCRQFRPPRAHHCRHCRRCILRMDHHCPWTNNCIGHGNYRHFLRFILSVDVACSYHLYLLTTHALLVPPRTMPPTWNIVLLALNYVACVPVLLIVGAFSIYHVIALARNTTTIEAGEKDRAQTLRRRGRIAAPDAVFPFDLGSALANVRSVLGHNAVWWCVPGANGPAAHDDDDDDGFEWRTASNVRPLAEYVWPPRDLFDRRRVLLAGLSSSSSEEDYDDGDERRDYYDDESDGARPRRRVSPYARGDDDDDDDDDGGGGEDGGAGAGAGKAEPRAFVRMRRGSEGYEVRPVRVQYDYDDEGDPVIRASHGRYSRYVREPSSEPSVDDDDDDDD